LRSGWRQRNPCFAALVAILLALFCIAGCSSNAKPASVGVVLGHNAKTGTLHIRQVPPGLAGDKAGLRPGDRVKMIDGRLADDMPKARVRELLRGKEGTSVVLTILRGDRVLHITVVREPLGKAPATPKKKR
jgi:C-terminal processing protease CtpA/Prc